MYLIGENLMQWFVLSGSEFIINYTKAHSMHTMGAHKLVFKTPLSLEIVLVC